MFANILGENRKRNAWAPERGVVGGWCEGALKFEQKIQVLVKGVCLCFALETELGTDFRVGKRV